MDIKNLSDSAILICDDSITSINVLSKLLESEGIVRIQSFTDPRQVLPFLIQIAAKIDLLILDFEMPHLNGIEVMSQIDAAFPQQRPFAILMITGMQDREVKHRALVAGANDFLDKPFDPVEVWLRVQNLLRVQRALKAQTQLAQELERQVKVRTAQLAAINEKLEEQVAHRSQELLRAEKMAAVGRLAAGVAHEINNPISFVQSNLSSLKNYADELLNLIDAMRAAAGDEAGITALLKKTDLPFLREDLLDLIGESRAGLARVADIVKKLKDFSRIDQSQIQDTDLNADLENSLQLAYHSIEKPIEVIRDYGQLPKVRCIPAQINQVFFNIILNAIQAMETAGSLTLRTRDNDGWVEISIRDTGVGIPEPVLSHIFDPFFTTRPVGKGMGLGLSEAYHIINQHGGRIDVRSLPGQGSIFRIRLPLKNVSAQLDD